MQKQFGKRGNTNPNTYKVNQVSPTQGHSVQDGPDHEVNSEREGGRIKSFLIAVIAGLSFSFLSMGFFIENNAPSFFVTRLFFSIAAAFAMLPILPYIFVPARLLASIMNYLRIPRGYSDMLIGAMVGSLMFLPELHRTEPISWMKLAFVFGGAFGGFTYWRSRGYPGLRKAQTERAETTFSQIKKIRPLQY